MFCPQCGKLAAADAKFCGHCGASLEAGAEDVEFAHVDESVTSLGPEQPTAAGRHEPAPAPVAVPQVRPWVRYWARMIDLYLLAVLGGFILAITAPDVVGDKVFDQVYGMIVIFLWIFIESILLATVGTTPGKWLLKTKLVPPTGQKASYATAMSRSLKVWWRGWGTGFPIASLFTLLVAYRHLTDNGKTTWDQDDGFSVVHQRIGPLRITVLVTLLVGVVWLTIYGATET